MNNYDVAMNIGISDPQGRQIWKEVNHMTHNQILQRLRDEQIMASNAFKGDRVEDAAIKRLVVRRCILLELFAWRIYMFGSEATAVHPGKTGELRKRQRTDPRYWKKVEVSNTEHGTRGCQQLNNLYRRNKIPCAVPRCTHSGQKYADKWLKSIIRQEWEGTIFRKYRY